MFYVSIDASINDIWNVCMYAFHEASLCNVKKLKKQGFIHWWVYVTPSGLMFLLAAAVIIGVHNGVHNFNEWINRK